MVKKKRERNTNRTNIYIYIHTHTNRTKTQGNDEWSQTNVGQALFYWEAFAVSAQVNMNK
jgi:hypothetical protein